MILSRQVASLWRFLGINDAPGLTTTADVTLGFQLGDVSEHGPPNMGVRAAASGFAFGFGTLPTWEFRSEAPGGALLRRMSVSSALVSQQISLKLTESALAFTGAVTPSDTVDIGVGSASSTLNSGVFAAAYPAPFYQVNGQANTPLDLWVPPGSLLYVQAPINQLGFVNLEWTEFPESLQ